MACETQIGDFDVKTSSLLDWHHTQDCLPLIPQSPSDRRLKPSKSNQRRKSKERSADTKVKVKTQKWSFGKNYHGESDEERLLSERSREDLIDLQTEKEGKEESLRTKKDHSGHLEKTPQIMKLRKSDDSRSDSDKELLIKEVGTKTLSQIDGSRDTDIEERPGNDLSDDNKEDTVQHPAKTSYLTPIEDDESKLEVKESDVTTRLIHAEEEVSQSLHDAIEVLDNKRTFLLEKLKKLRQKKEKDVKDREKVKAKTPIQVLKSSRGSPTPASDSDNDLESVFVRKKVIRTDKRKMELRMMAEMDVILSKVQNIALAAQKIKFMTPFLEAKICADVDSDEETPDLVDVLAVSIGDKHVVMTTDFKNASLKSFIHHRGDMTNSVLKFDNSPWGITRMDMNTVAVSIPLANKLALVNVTSGVKLEETIRTKKQYYGLVSIGSSLIVATSPYSNPRSVDTLDLTGSILKTMVVDTLLQQPSFICSTPSGGFVLSDLAKGAMLGVTNTLELGRGFEIGDEAQLQSTRGVTTNKDGDVFVVDYRQKKVKVFSGEGRFIKDFMTSADGLKYPYGLCFDNHGHLFVTDGGVIKIFNY